MFSTLIVMFRPFGSFLLRQLAFFSLLFSFSALGQIQLPGLGGSTCDPTRQSCAGTTQPPILGDADGGAGPGAGGSCKPSASGSPCDGSGPASQGNNSGTNQGAGNPINITNGNKYQMEVDMPALPGELGLELVRHYNSANARVLGALGAGWRLSYETELYEVGNTVQVLQADGSRIIFAIDPANPSHCASNDPTQGHIAIGQRSSNGQPRKTYTWHWSHGPHAGRTLRFNADGKLQSITAASGASLTLQHSPNGQLTQVTDPQGRSLILGYPDKAQIVQAQANAQEALFAGVQSITTPLGRITYRHGTQKSNAPNLLGVSLPGQIQRQYHYEDQRWPQMLTGISVRSTDHDGNTTEQRLSTYRYDERGRGILSTKGMPEGDTPGQEQITLDYLTPTLPAKEGRTLLTNSLGQHTLYRQRIIAGQYRLVEARGAGCAQCAPVNIRYHYDDQGRLIAQDSLAPTIIEPNQEPPPAKTLHSTRIQLTAQGAIGQHGQERAYYEDPRWPDKPTRITRPSVVAGQQQQLTLRYNAAGQITELTHRGLSPIDGEGQQQPTAIERTTRYRYEEINGRSLLMEVDGPLANGPKGQPGDSDITRLQWDGKGNHIVQITNPGGNQHHLQHDRAGRLAQVRNDAGFATHFAYDSQSRITHIISTAAGWQQPQVRSYRYNALGQMVETGTGHNPNEALPPELTALLQTAAAYTPTLAQQFDSTGRPIWQASALGLLHTRSYDSESRTTASGQHSSRIARTEAWDYNAHGQITRWSDNAGRFARIDYDHQGRPLAYHDSTGRSIELPGSRQTRPAASKAQTVTPTRWQDDFGRTVLTDDGQHGRHTLTWDGADRLIAMHDALGHQARYAYDSSGRITEQHIHSADGTNQTTRWRYQGRHLLAIEHPTQTEHYRYDQRGLIASRSITRTATNGQSPPTTSHTRYLHDAQGRLVATSLPDGHWLHYQRNGQGQVIAVVRSPVQRPWLRTLAAEDAIASHLQRNLAGLQSYSAGNGIHSQWLRDGTGTLAGIVHSRPSTGKRQLHAQAQTQTPLWPATASVVQRLLGIGNAQASSPTTSATTPATLAFFDERYLWSGDGLLLHSQRSRPGGAEQRYWAYDGAGQLVAGVQTGQQDTQVWRYAYQGQRRVLAQHTNNQQELSAGTTGTAWDAQGRPTNQDAATAYNPNGQPTGQGQRSYQWDSLGRLIAISQNNAEIARYRYDHRGLRIAKDAGGHSTGYLYSADRHLLAELNASGHMERQYIYLADLLLAVIDTPKGAKLAQTVEPSTEPLEQTIGLWADVKALLSSYLPNNATLAYIHSNHLGAPEAATNENGELVWQASYAPFGAASIQNGQKKPNNTFTLNIRLPGQYFDEETGLHYNRQRYYDPAQGAYLTPDPLGHPDGPNAYAYVANNPLGLVDPDGLVLFAFDGTGNDESNPDALTNVVNFRDLYKDEGGNKYVTGVGTDHKGRDTYGDIISKEYDKTLVPWIVKIPDRGGNYSGPARIERMLLYFVDAAEAFENNNEAMNIDIVGFSRGAAQARDFANRLVGMLKDGAIWYQKHDSDGNILEGQWGCQVVNFRFMGIFDTVLSTNFSKTSYNLSIPSQFAYVAHAVALNEHRSSGPAGEEAFWTAPIRNFPLWDKTRLHLPQDDHYGGFPLQSIGASSNTPGQIRIELGFIGAHSDIGGGYADGGVLSDVALAWMLRQATNAGVVMDTSSIRMEGTAILHDQANTMRFGNPNTAPPEIVIKIPTGNSNTYPDIEYDIYKFPIEDREVRGAVGGSTQRTQSFSNASQTGGATSMANADTYRFIHYDDRGKDKEGIPTPQSTMPSNQIPELQNRAPSEKNPCTPATPGNCNRTGTVDLPSYIRWLLDNGYEL